MQHIHAGYTPEDAVFHAELDTHAETVQENPKKTEKPKATPSSSVEAKPRAKRASRKKASGNHESPQGDLPL